MAEKLKKGYASAADPGAGKSAAKPAAAAAAPTPPPAAAAAPAPAATGKRAASSAPPPTSAPALLKKARGGAGGAPDPEALASLAAAAPPASAASVAASAAAGDAVTIYLECHEGTSNKFYRISLAGTSVESVYGPCGAAGTRLEKSFATPVSWPPTSVCIHVASSECSPVGRSAQVLRQDCRG